MIKNAILLERWPVLRMYLKLFKENALSYRGAFCRRVGYLCRTAHFRTSQPTSIPSKATEGYRGQGTPQSLRPLPLMFLTNQDSAGRATLLRKQRNFSRRHSFQEYIDNRPLAVSPAVQMLSYRPFRHGHRPFSHLGLPLDGETDQEKEEDQGEMQTPHLELP